jgi:hypothetical protein
VLLIATALAAFYRPPGALAIIVIGAASVTVALTGFCVVGSLLKPLGFTPMLGRSGPTLWATCTSCRPTAGISSAGSSWRSGSTSRSCRRYRSWHSPRWLLFTGFVGVAMVWFGPAPSRAWSASTAPPAPSLPAAASRCRVTRAQALAEAWGTSWPQAASV